MTTMRNGWYEAHGPDGLTYGEAVHNARKGAMEGSRDNHYQHSPGETVVWLDYGWGVLSIWSWAFVDERISGEPFIFIDTHGTITGP